MQPRPRLPQKKSTKKKDTGIDTHNKPDNISTYNITKQSVLEML